MFPTVFQVDEHVMARQKGLRIGHIVFNMFIKIGFQKDGKHLLKKMDTLF
jgi:hypothetical protein